MLHLRARRAEHPTEVQLDVLQQVTRQLDVSHVGRVVLRADVVVLHDAGGVEVVHEVLARVVPGAEVLVDALDLGDEAAALRVGVAHRAEAFPQREKDDLRPGPDGVHFFDELDVAAVELAGGDVVGGVVVVRADVDDDDVGGWRRGVSVRERTELSLRLEEGRFTLMLVEGPGFGIVAPNFNGAA